MICLGSSTIEMQGVVLVATIFMSPMLASAQSALGRVTLDLFSLGR